MRNSDAGSHSSEEELEEINLRQGLSIGVTEKRKRPELSTTEPSSESDFDCGDYLAAEIRRPLRLCSLNENSISHSFSVVPPPPPPNQDDPDDYCQRAICGGPQHNEKKLQDPESPVQFSALPPPHAQRPRNSEFAHKTNFGFRHQSPCTTSQDNVHHSSSSDQLAEQSTNQLIPLVLPGDDLNGRNPQVNQLLFGLTTTIDVETTTPTTVNSTPATTAARRLATPRKKSRKLSSQHLLAGKSSSSSSHHLLARPCLDFEKMQQMESVSSLGWQASEMSTLVCW